MTKIGTVLETGFALFETAIGTCGITWTERGVSSTRLPERDDAELRRQITATHPGATETTPPRMVAEAIDGMRSLLNGRPADLTAVPLEDGHLETFARSVYEVARTVPPGTTTTYGAIAARLGDPALARAVGRALGSNPFPLIVPCHRVVAAHGELGGFSAHGGTITKRKLLAIEGEPLLGAPTLFDLDER